MRAFGSARGLVRVGTLALAPGACSSGNGSAEGAAPPASDYPTLAGGCADAAGLTGAIEDRGTAEASGGAVTLDASEFAFAPTRVESGAGETFEVTVTNTGSALHNLSIGSLGIDEDVQAGQTITVQVRLPGSGAVPFVCKYHTANGMQGAFLIG
ncbi:MAG: cupredoxin domain-containing protein [bacterium]